MAKKALIILAEGFEEIEATTTIDILRRADIQVTIAGLSSLVVQGSRGIILQTDTLLADISSDFDALILPGGMPGATNLATSDIVTKTIEKMHDKHKIIAAICAAPAIVLAPKGVLANKQATCYPGMEKKFAADIRYSSDDVVVDDNIITSRGPATAFRFALTIVEILIGKEKRDAVGQAALYT